MTVNQIAYPNFAHVHIGRASLVVQIVAAGVVQEQEQKPCRPALVHEPDKPEEVTKG